METLKAIKKVQKIDLINGCFTASEANHIINSVLNVKINFHKIQRLSIREGNDEDKCEFDSGRIEELINEQRISKEFFSQARLEGKKLKMTSTIHVEIED